MAIICLKLFEFVQVVPENHLPEEGSWSRGDKAFSMLNSAEHEIYDAHKC